MADINLLGELEYIEITVAIFGRSIMMGRTVIIAIAQQLLRGNALTSFQWIRRT